MKNSILKCSKKDILVEYAYRQLSGEKAPTFHTLLFVHAEDTSAGVLRAAMGIALLMRYLPMKKFFAYYIIGFVLMAYLPSNFTILGVSLAGLALAAIYLSNTENNAAAAVTGGSDDMEVEIDE